MESSVTTSKNHHIFMVQYNFSFSQSTIGHFFFGEIELLFIVELTELKKAYFTLLLAFVDSFTASLALSKALFFLCKYFVMISGFASFCSNSIYLLFIFLYN